MILPIISLIVALASAIFSFIALFYNHIQNKREKLDYVMENLTGISILLADAYKALSYNKFDNCFDVSKIENKLIVGSHYLFSFGTSNHYDNLVEFSIINPIETRERDKSFFFVFFSIEDRYLKFRDNIKSKNEDLTKCDKKIISMYVKCFRDLINLASLYAINFLCKNNGKCKKRISDQYYSRLATIYYEGQKIC